jgi:RNA polymerase sigma factor (sigma-70 family)
MSDSPPVAPPDAPASPATRAFLDHRELLFSIVYNLLGSVADTEDALQETWLAWASRAQAPHGAPIEHPRAYLVRIAVRQALDRQAALRRRRETYVGPWLPEPLVTPLPDAPGAADAADAADAAVRAEAVSMALLVVLETLTPLERAVFVLGEVFGYAHPEIAAILGRRPTAIRQLAHRAREHVRARRPRYQADPRLHQRITERFVAAVAGGDLPALLRLLAPEVTLWADGGGKAPWADGRGQGPAGGWRPVHGRDRVARVLAAGATRTAAGLGVRYRRVNGDPAVLLVTGDSPFAVVVLDLTPDGQHICGIYAVTSPDKLARIDRTPEHESIGEAT